MAVLKLVFFACFANSVIAKGSDFKVDCSSDTMKVTVPMDGDRKLSYLDQLKDYKPCKPLMEGEMAMFMLDLQDHHKCGVTKVLNKITGKRTFYHNVVTENAAGDREMVTVRCVVVPERSRRDVPFPLDFNEPDELNITRYEEGHAPEPVLGAVVKQNGKQVSGEISVSPGTPLSMEIFLDNSSAPVYGLAVSYMHVTDTGKQQETIILNGCSVDPYLFDNFVTSSGDILTAKFRAFKFPDTTYVQFKGTVTVCLDKCQGVQCSNGVTGYGRRRRAISSSAESNKVFEVSLTTFIKVDWEEGKEGKREDVLELMNLKKINEERNLNNQMLGDQEGTSATVAEHTQDNIFVLHSPSINKSSNYLLSYLILGLSLSFHLIK